MGHRLQFHIEPFSMITMEQDLLTVNVEDLSEVLSDIYIGDILDTLEFGDIMEYVAQRRAEDNNE